MIAGAEIAEGIWFFQSSEDSRNYIIVLGDGGAVLVDPTPPVEMDAVRRFLQEGGYALKAVAFTSLALAPEKLSSGIADAWSGVPHITPATVGGRSPLPGMPESWEVVPLGSGEHIGLYNTAQRVLLSGGVLSGGPIPSLKQESRSYIAALDAIDGLGARLVVPASGHIARGKRAIRERIQRERSYISSLRIHVISAIVSEVPLDRVLEVAASVYEQYPFVNAHLQNISVVWNELAAPDD
jgi:glyoxylase-like metal-dependent hydrolase (beta-lactamase superfamily II)